MWLLPSPKHHPEKHVTVMCRPNKRLTVPAVPTSKPHRIKSGTRTKTITNRLHSQMLASVQVNCGEQNSSSHCDSPIMHMSRPSPLRFQLQQPEMKCFGNHCKYYDGRCKMPLHKRSANPLSAAQLMCQHHVLLSCFACDEQGTKHLCKLHT